MICKFLNIWNVNFEERGVFNKLSFEVLMYNICVYIENFIGFKFKWILGYKFINRVFLFFIFYIYGKINKFIKE